MKVQEHITVTLAHCLGPEPGPGQETGPVLCTTFHIVPGLGRMGCTGFNKNGNEGPERTLVFIRLSEPENWVHTTQVLTGFWCSQGSGPV